MKKANKIINVLGYAGLLMACFAWGWNYPEVKKSWKETE